MNWTILCIDEQEKGVKSIEQIYILKNKKVVDWIDLFYV